MPTQPNGLWKPIEGLDERNLKCPVPMRETNKNLDLGCNVQAICLSLIWGPFVLGDQIFGDHLSLGTEFDGDHLSRGINFIGIVCPGGQSVRDRKSWDQMDLGPNASQSIFYHPKIKQFF